MLPLGDAPSGGGTTPRTLCESAKQVNTSGVRRRASREDDLPIDFIKRRVVIFCFFLSRLDCLNCINCNPVPRGTRNHSHEALLNSGLALADSGAPVGPGDHAKPGPSEYPAPAAYSAVPKIS